MNLTGISELWFGQNIYNFDNYTIFHSGRPVLGSAEAVDRNEGVGIVLGPCMSTEVLVEVSSRLVLARVKLEGQRGEALPCPNMPQ